MALTLAMAMTANDFNYYYIDQLLLRFTTELFEYGLRNYSINHK